MARSRSTGAPLGGTLQHAPCAVTSASSAVSGPAVSRTQRPNTASTTTGAASSAVAGTPIALERGWLDGIRGWHPWMVRPACPGPSRPTCRRAPAPPDGLLLHLLHGAMPHFQLQHGRQRSQRPLPLPIPHFWHSPRRSTFRFSSIEPCWTGDAEPKRTNQRHGPDGQDSPSMHAPVSHGASRAYMPELLLT